MYKLMIVEDEAIIRKGLVNAIDWHSLGFTVTGDAENGKQVLRCIEEQPPDVLMTDIRMPIMDGLELMSIVSAKYPAIRQVVLSGYGDFSYAQHAIRCGVLAYILKPTKDVEIYAAFGRVKAALDGKGPAAPPRLPPQEHRRRDPLIARVQDYIDEKFSNKVTLDEVAQMVHMNPTYFSTYFKQKSGQTFKDYLFGVRMRRARELALETDLKTYHIAVMVGYDDSRYFSKLFREAYGQSISELRREGTHEA